MNDENYILEQIKLIGEQVALFDRLFGSFASVEATQFFDEYNIDISKLLEHAHSKHMAPNQTTFKLKKFLAQKGERYKQQQSFHSRFLLIEELSKCVPVTLKDLHELHVSAAADGTDTQFIGGPNNVVYSAQVEFENKYKNATCVRLSSCVIPAAKNRISRKYGNVLLNVSFKFDRLNWFDNLEYMSMELDSKEDRERKYEILDILLQQLLYHFDPDRSRVGPHFQSCDKFRFLKLADKIRRSEDIRLSIQDICQNGIEIAGHRYIFLTASLSGIQSMRFTFIKSPNLLVSAESFRHQVVQWIFSNKSLEQLSATPIKMGLRMSLLLSHTIPTIEVSKEKYMNTKDISKEYIQCRFDTDGDHITVVLSGKVYTFSDGCGRMSVAYATKIYKEYKAKRQLYVERRRKEYVQDMLLVDEYDDSLCPCADYASAVQIRFGPAKGMLVVDPSLDGQQHELLLPQSMIKFEMGDETDPLHNTVEVIDCSRPTRDASLNQALVYLFAGCCRKNELHTISLWLFNHVSSFVEQKLDEFTTDRSALMRNCLEEGDYKSFTTAGLDNSPSAVFTYLLRTCMNLRIPLPDSRRLYGVIDYSNTLSAGEVSIYVDGKFLTGDVLITKEPCFHRGDLICLKAIANPALYHLKHVIVFSQQSPRPDFDRICGSDLDGDRYFVTWNHEIVSRFSGFGSAEYSGSDSYVKEHVINASVSNTLNSMVDEILSRVFYKNGTCMPSDIINIRQRYLALLEDKMWTNDLLWIETPVFDLLNTLFSISIDGWKSGGAISMNVLRDTINLADIPKNPQFHAEAHMNNREKSNCIVTFLLQIIASYFIKKLKLHGNEPPPGADMTAEQNMLEFVEFTLTSNPEFIQVRQPLRNLIDVTNIDHFNLGMADCLEWYQILVDISHTVYRHFTDPPVQSLSHFGAPVFRFYELRKGAKTIVEMLAFHIVKQKYFCYETLWTFARSNKEELCVLVIPKHLRSVSQSDATDIVEIIGDRQVVSITQTNNLKNSKKIFSRNGLEVYLFDSKEASFSFRESYCVRMSRKQLRHSPVNMSPVWSSFVMSHILQNALTNHNLKFAVTSACTDEERTQICARVMEWLYTHLYQLLRNCFEKVENRYTLKKNVADAFTDLLDVSARNNMTIECAISLQNCTRIIIDSLMPIPLCEQIVSISKTFGFMSQKALKEAIITIHNSGLGGILRCDWCGTDNINNIDITCPSCETALYCSEKCKTDHKSSHYC